MSFAHAWLWPSAAVLLVMIPLLAAVLALVERRRDRRLAAELGPRAEALAAERSPKRRRMRRVLALAGLLFAVLALMQPAWGDASQADAQGGVDLVLALDVSRSMLAQDVAPTRLARARDEILELAKQSGGSRLALVLFAGDARIASPLTSDLESFAAIVAHADPSATERGGSDLGGALATALSALGGERRAPAAIVLLTDGEDLGGRFEPAVRECVQRGVVVHTVGFGSTRGSKIALEEATGTRFLKDAAGRDVVSVLDRAALQRISHETAGEFVDASAQPSALVELHQRWNAGSYRAVASALQRRERRNRFQWPLSLALLLWLAELGLGETIARAVDRRPS